SATESVSRWRVARGSSGNTFPNIANDFEAFARAISLPATEPPRSLTGQFVSGRRRVSSFPEPSKVQIGNSLKSAGRSCSIVFLAVGVLVRASGTLLAQPLPRGHHSRRSDCPTAISTPIAPCGLRNHHTASAL